jgi:GNAT superfamily N-acetyltransferase
MLAAPVSIAGQIVSGPRPINLGKDSQQVLELLDLAFGPLPGGRGQRLLINASRSNIGAPFGPFFRGPVPGFVWEEDGRIVGTLSLLASGKPGRYLIANVAVQPGYRRRGIATGLMSYSTEYISKQGGREIFLQVERENEAALRLYTMLDFATLGEVNRWESSSQRLRSLATAPNKEIRIRSISKKDERAAFNLDLKCMPPDLHWPDPPSPKRYETGFWRRLGDFFNGRGFNTLVADVPTEQFRRRRLVGLATIESEWGKPQELAVRVAADWRGKLERELLSSLVAEIKRNRSGRLRVSHLAHDEVMNGLLREANFTLKRSLRVMRYALSK